MNELRIEQKAAVDDDSFTLADFARAVRKRLWLVGGALMLSLIAAGFITSVQTRIYQSEAVLHFFPTPPRPLGKEVEPVVELPHDYWSRKEYYKTQHFLLTSTGVLRPVAMKMRLRWDRGFVENGPTQNLETEPLISLEQSVTILARRIDVEPIKDSRLAKVSIRDANAERAQKILTEILAQYVSQSEESVLSATTDAARWLSEQLSTLRIELEESELALHDYKKAKDLLSVSLDDQSGMLRAEIGEFNGVLTKARADRERLQSRYRELAKVAEDNPRELPVRELLESTVLQQLRAVYLVASKELSSLKGSGKGDKHPLVLSASRRVGASRDALLAEVKNIKVALKRDVSARDSEIAGLRGLYESARSRALDLNKLEIEHKRLRRARDTNENLLTLVTERSKESDLARMLRINNVRVIEAANKPTGPISPNLPINLLLGGLAGIILGLGGAVGSEMLDRTVRDPIDAEKSLDLPMLGALPTIGTGPSPYAYAKKSRRQRKGKGEQVELASHTNPTGSFAEAVRAVRTSIVFSSPDKPLKRLLITSANAGAGKTTLACNVATTLAQTDKRVLLIDCDLRRPRLHQVFAKQNGEGLMTAILRPDTYLSTVQSTDVPNLSVMCSGTLPPNPSEVLQSHAFRDLLDRLDERFDILVLDSPPLMPVTDAAVIAPQTDGVVLVLRALQTVRAEAKRSLALLNGVGSHTLGTVVNAVREGSGRSGYYYHYGTYRRSDDS